MQDFLRDNPEALEHISESTNDVYRFNHAGTAYILKRNRMAGGWVSPFWQTLRDVFGSTPQAQLAQLVPLIDCLERNPHIPPAALVAWDEAKLEHIYAAVEGIAYEPDMFPTSPNALYQLGQYIGYLHTHTQAAGYGMFQATPQAGSFHKRLTEVMQDIIAAYWTERPDVVAAFERIRAMPVALGPYSLIMPDISANQFIFDEDLSSIRAVIDFDAYVVGPPQWELAILEMCLPEGADFRRGYETYAPLPRMESTRLLFRLASFLCDPWDAGDLEKFLHDGWIFA